MDKKIPKKLLSNKYRKESWNNVEKIIKQISKNLPITSMEIIGSFATKKKRPADVDFMVLLKTTKNNNKKWSVDLVIAPDNKHGKGVSDDAHKWVAQKYGKKNYTSFRLK
jgi:hypothetical protein